MNEKSNRLGSRQRSILSEEQKVKILQLREMGISLPNICTRFGITRSLLVYTLTTMRRKVAQQQ